MIATATTMTDLRDAIAAKEIAAADATRAYLDRIEQLNAKINAVTEVYADRATDTAAAVDRGEITGPLAGVPLLIKDLLCTTYGHTTCSSRMLKTFKSPYTATAVRKLEEAGAIILGKTNMDEFAMGSSCEHSAFGRTCNPWDLDCVPGGSSGGSAAAMAADLCAGAIGTDTGGSIRQPASHCGIVGLKPTYGRVSRYGLVAFASSLDQIGPMTRTVKDAALLLQVLAGHDANDSTSAKEVVPDFVAAVDTPSSNMRIGLAKQYMSDANHPDIAEALNQAIGAYKDAGATIVDVDLPHTEYGIPTYYLVATAEASSNLARYDGVHFGHRSAEATDLIDLYERSRAEGFGDEVKRRIMLGTYALSSGYYDAYYLRALKVRRLIRQDFDAAFERCDAILCPVAPSPAFRAGERTQDPLSMYMGDVYTVNANLAGIPGIVVPAGMTTTDRKNLPIGLQLLGPHFQEASLFGLARVLEKSMGQGAGRPDLR